MKKDSANSRRKFLITAGKAGLATSLSFSVLPSLAGQYKDVFDFPFTDEDVPYQQQPLIYSYKDLEPVIDALTMEIHYSKHAASYAKNLAEAATAEGVDTAKTSLTQLLSKISRYSVKMKNNAGGHYNHELFWKSMKAPSENNKPTGSLLQAIEKDFNSFDAFATQFADAGKSRFGSGWAWLVKKRNGKLLIGSTPNQDNPLMNSSDLKGIPLLGLDVWEHAYYLKYQNRRADYITAWWKVVNWDAIQKRFEMPA